MKGGCASPEPPLDPALCTYLRKASIVTKEEYCWLTFSEGEVQGGGFMGIPGGTRPQMWDTMSTSRLRFTVMEERCFTPGLGTSEVVLYNIVFLVCVLSKFFNDIAKMYK